jgi:predicted AAA+ superfamily ATPase
VDFVIAKAGLKAEQLIQVCWDIRDNKTKDREIAGLLKAMDAFGLKEGLIITEDYEADEKIGAKKIIFAPLWKWLLSPL